MAPRYFRRIVISIVSLLIPFASFAGPARALSVHTTFPLQVHIFEFYLDPALAPDMDFARAVLPKYVADLNTVLAKNTHRRLALDAMTGIVLTTTQPHTDSASSPLPVDGFEIWAHAVHTAYPLSYGGYAGIDQSGAGVLAGLRWTRLYDPDRLQPHQVADYWTQINNMLHELAHVFGAGLGEYYNLVSVQDTTNTAPLLNIDLLSAADPFWQDKTDFLTDPLLQNPVHAPNLGTFANRAALLAFARYSGLTAAVIDGGYRNALPAVDLSDISVHVVDAGGSPVASADVRIWSVFGDASHQSQLMVEGTTDGNGRLSFAWGGSGMPHNVYDFLRLIKIRADGYTGAARYVSIFDADIARLLQGQEKMTISVTLAAASPASSFTDVSIHDAAWPSIEAIYAAGITGGCGRSPLIYCPAAPVTRAQMAVFLERGIRSSSYTPPAISSTAFEDVSPSYWAASWIAQLAVDGITGGCGGGKYCPDQPVTRAQMAVFLLRAKYGASYVPPAVKDSTGFTDVPAGHWAAAWIQQLAAEGITSGCGRTSYCPETPITRAQLAVFMTKTFDLR